MFERQDNIKFPVDWDIPRPNSLSKLIAARLEFKKCHVKLKDQLNETETMKIEIEESKKELEKKKNALKTLHLDFETLESEDKKQRARDKLEEERQVQIKLKEHLKKVKEEVQQLGAVKEKMETYLKQYRKFEVYLSYVVQHYKELVSVEEILDRYRTLRNTQTQLEQTLEADLQFMIESRNDSDDLMEEKCNAINILNNRLAKIRVKSKSTSENVMYWETLVTTIKTFIAEKTLELEMVRDATWSLYMQMCRQHRVPDPEPRSNFDKQITFIYKTILQNKQILQIAKKKAGETFHSHCPNSSVVSINVKKTK